MCVMRFICLFVAFAAAAGEQSHFLQLLIVELL